MGMDFAELVMEVEERVGIEIPNEIAATLTTVGKLNAWVMGELHRLDRPLPAEDGFEQIRGIVSKLRGIKPAAILPESRFVEDLRAD